MRILPAALLILSAAHAASLPFQLASGRPAGDAVFHHDEPVRCMEASFTVTDAYGKVIGRGTRGSRLPTSRYGTFRVAGGGGRIVSYAVLPDVQAKRFPGSPFGMGAYFSMRYSQAELPRAAALFTRMGAASNRDELNWDLVEPEPGRWTWARCDAGVSVQHRFGIEPLGLLCYWGKYVKDRPERTGTPLAHSPEAIAAYAEYCRRCVARYKPGGTLATARGWKDGWGIRHWEVWNEPATFWTGTPEQFGALLKAAYRAIKAADPKAVVHFSNVGEDWDARALKVAGRSYDGLTPHYYCPPRSPDEAGMDRQMRETVRWYAARGLRGNLWVSEVGWDTTTDRRQEARQAQDLVRAYAMALDAGMDRVFWYNFRDDGPQSANGQTTWFGVLNRDFTPKISYAAYAAMVERLGGLEPAGRANFGAAVNAILFAGRPGSTAVIWADKQTGSLSSIPGTRTYDLMGNLTTGRIPLNDWPVYVVAPKKPASWLRARLQALSPTGIRPPRHSRPAGPPTVIPHGEGEAPILDQLWALKPQWKMNTAEHNAGILPWTPADLSATAQFQYDETGLWMRFIVTDNVFHQTRTGPDIWQEDSVQVSIQPDASKAASANRHSFGFALTPDGPKAFGYAGKGGWSGSVDVRRQGKLTTYDIRIPWPDLAPLHPLPGMHFLMNFMVNDNDGYGRRGWLEWTPGIGTGDDPSQWMEWTLGKVGPAPTSI